MGSENATEGPVHPVTVSAFWMDTHELTNTKFARLAQATVDVTVVMGSCALTWSAGSPNRNPIPRVTKSGLARQSVRQTTTPWPFSSRA